MTNKINIIDESILKKSISQGLKNNTIRTELIRQYNTDKLLWESGSFLDQVVESLDEPIRQPNSAIEIWQFSKPQLLGVKEILKEQIKVLNDNPHALKNL